MGVLFWPFHAIANFLRSRRLWKGILIFLIALMLLSISRSTHVLSPAQSAARGYEYGLVRWEVSNFFDKWVNQAKEFIPGLGSSDEEKRRALDRYLELNNAITVSESELDYEISSTHPDPDRLILLRKTLDVLESERRGLRDDVEELLESTIDAVLRDLGIGKLTALTWPPVDFRMDATPPVLITSPREIIQRKDSILIDADIALEERELIEAKVFELDSDLSAIVLSTGGVATFPAVIPDDRDLLPTLDVAAHEWLHAYLIFRPLGRAYWSSSEMTTLNETVANIFGEEVGRFAYARLTGETLAPIEQIGSGRPSDMDVETFSFRAFMRETRITTDEMLLDGDIEGAESYMEDRRIELQEHEIFIRKINQAYFAFKGSYGDNPASVSPIGAQVRELRTYVKSVGDLVKAVQSVTTYKEFIDVLESKRTEHG